MAFDLYRYIKGAGQFLNIVKSFGYAGAPVSIWFGIGLFLWHLQLWNLLPESTFKELVSGKAPDSVAVVCLFLVVFGCVSLYCRSNYKTFRRYKAIQKAEKQILIDAVTAFQARLIITSEFLGRSVHVIDDYFRNFLRYSENNNLLSSQDLDRVVMARLSFENSGHTTPCDA